jgi:hypothetical protein
MTAASVTERNPGSQPMGESNSHPATFAMSFSQIAT